ncbi:MAG: hypothetical protein EBU49_12585, partial [Proteobacteria bacterium]|nr:hypothetical protein [Pseudomonadota bacterium]
MHLLHGHSFWARRLLLPAFLRGIATGCAVWVGVVSQSGNAAIIGENNLLDWHEEADVGRRDASRATVVLIKKSHNWLQQNGDRWAFAADVPSFGQSDELCVGEPFREQPVPGDCSGFLIAPDAIATANHCLEPMGGCANITVAFDFRTVGPGQTTFDFGLDSVFHCVAVVANNEFEDW